MHTINIFLLHPNFWDSLPEFITFPNLWGGDAPPAPPSGTHMGAPPSLDKRERKGENGSYSALPPFKGCELDRVPFSIKITKVNLCLICLGVGGVGVAIYDYLKTE